MTIASSQVQKSGLSAAERSTALYAVSEYGEFFSLVEIAKLVQAELGLHPVFLFKSDYGALRNHTHLLERLNFSWTTALSDKLEFDARGVEPGLSDYIPTNLLREASLKGTDEQAAVSGPAANMSPAASLLWDLRLFAERVRSRLQRGRSADIAAERRPFFNLIGYYRKKLNLMDRIIVRFRPQVIITGQDYPLSISTLAGHAGAKAGIPMAVIPFSMTPTTKEIAESFFGSRTNEIKRRLLTPRFQAVLGNWLHTYRGRVYSRLSIPEARASDALRLTPSQPWTPNSGLGVVFAPSPQGHDYAGMAGIAENQRRLTGALWSDKLIGQAETRSERRDSLMRDILVFETYARNVARSRTVPRRPDPIRVEASDKDRTLLIFSWPPNQNPRKANGFATVEEMNAALAEMLIALAMSASVKIAISLHPTLVGTSLGTELKRAGLYVIDRPLIEVVDCADIFCATVSSTLLWSVQAGVPSVNLDIYSYGYIEFKEAGMCEASTVPGLKAELLKLIEDQTYRDAVKASQDRVREHWTMPDGKASERIIAALASMLPDGAEKR